MARETALAIRFFALFRVGNQRQNHPVQIVEETDEVESQLEEAFLLMARQRPKDFCCVQRMIFLHDLVHVEGDQRSIEQESYPLPTEEEEHRHNGMCGHLGQDEL